MIDHFRDGTEMVNVKQLYKRKIANARKAYPS